MVTTTECQQGPGVAHGHMGWLTSERMDHSACVSLNRSVPHLGHLSQKSLLMPLSVRSWMLKSPLRLSVKCQMFYPTYSDFSRPFDFLHTAGWESCDQENVSQFCCWQWKRGFMFRHIYQDDSTEIWEHFLIHSFMLSWGVFWWWHLIWMQTMFHFT